MKFAIDPPAGLAEKSLYFLAQIEPASREYAGRSWDVASTDKTYFLLDATGKIVGQLLAKVVEKHEAYGGGYIVSFADRISPEALVSPGHELLNAQSRLLLAVYAAETDEGENPIPPLKQLNVQFLRSMFGPAKDGDLTVHLDEDSHTAFWRDLTDKLADSKR